MSFHAGYFHCKFSWRLNLACPTLKSFTWNPLIPKTDFASVLPLDNGVFIHHSIKTSMFMIFFGISSLSSLLFSFKLRKKNY